MDELTNRLECVHRIIVKQEVGAKRHLPDLDGTRPEPGQIRKRLVGFAIENKTRNGQSEKRLDETPGIGLCYRLKCIAVITTNIDVQRYVVRDDLFSR